jgi:hypothetical protein
MMFPLRPGPRAAFVMALTFCASAHAGQIYYSVDIASPVITTGVQARDILTPGPSTFILGSTLGMQSGDSFGDFSYGNDPIQTPLYFSVDRVAVGVPGSDVATNSAAGGANGSVYVALPPLNSNTTALHDTTLGLTGGLFGDDVHGLTLMPYTGRVYFSLEQFSTSLSGGLSAADIFLNKVGNIFADHTTMQLDPGDEIDGLVLLDSGTIGLLDPGIDVGLFSISAFSPDSTLLGGSLDPSAVYLTRFDDTPPILFASAASLGLRPDDELHALATSDMVITDLPEPRMWILTLGGLALLFLLRTRRPAALLTLLGCLGVAGLHAQDRRDYCGVDMALAGTGGNLVFQDLSASRKIRWASTDPVVGDVNTDFVTPPTWTRTGANPERIVFVVTVNGVMIQGDVLLAPANRGTVTLIKGAVRSRYEVILGSKLPLGGSAGPAAADSCYKTYIPDRFGGVFNVTPDAAGTLKDLRGPDGKPFANNTDTGKDKFGWYTFRVTGKNFNVSNTFAQTGTADTVPWNFWYFPYNPTNPATGLRLYDNPGAYTKFDTTYTLGTDSFDWEVANHKQGAAVGWAGHCWGAALASIILKQPAAFGAYTEDDLEGISSDFFDNFGGTKVSPTSIGIFPVTVPTAADTDDVDPYVDEFHIALRNMLRDQKKAVLIDLRQSGGAGAAEVWNQGCYTYTAQMRETPTAAGDSLTQKIREIEITNTFVCNSDFLLSSVSAGNPKDAPRNRREQESKYILIYATDGEVDPNGSLAGVKQNWMTMKLTFDINAAKANDVYVPKLMIDASPAGAKYKNDATAGKNPFVTGKRLTTLGLSKNTGF